MTNVSRFLLILLVTSCTTISVYQFDQVYGTSDPINRSNAPLATSIQAVHYNEKIKPIIESRCVVCHGCYDAPCQLKLESQIGLERGANKAKVYDGARLRTAPPTNFVNNIKSVEHWRKQNFFPVLNERNQTAQANVNASVFYQMLKLKKDNPLPNTPLLDNSFDLRLDRNQQCPTIEEFENYKKNTPLAGMPFGLPNLPESEYNLLTQWLEKGAVTAKNNQLTSIEEMLINKWEAFLNGDSFKEQLVARYIFEHLYLANLYFSSEQQRYFNLVRSSTPSGEQIQPIISRRPYDDPNVDRVYYRIKLNESTIIAKRHMPYRFDLAKLARYQTLFVDQAFIVDELPSYSIELASNPFKTFQAIPVKSRYLFLLEEAQFSIMNFIKGPVCRGQIALNVINDHFWVFFNNPDNIDLYHVDQFLATQSEHLTLPAEKNNGVLSILNWHKYARKQQEYLKAKQTYLREMKLKKTDLNINLIWQGKGNPNAALTVFRHFDSASVLQGTVGQQPKTTWIIGYPLMERIHYLLVAGFDVYGDVSHQLKTRLYMDFLRMEGESNFIALLPKSQRNKTFESWYINTDNAISGFTYAEESALLPDADIPYKTNETKAELQEILSAYIDESSPDNYSLKTQDTYSTSLNKLTQLSKKSLTFLPQVSYLKVATSTDQVNFYTLLHNNDHSNVAHLFSEDKRRLPENDSLTITKGIVGTYPNAFFALKAEQIPQFISLVTNMNKAEDYTFLKDKFGVRRTSSNFWQFTDELHQWFLKNQSLEYGLLDFNRLENK